MDKTRTRTKTKTLLKFPKTELYYSSHTQEKKKERERERLCKLLSLVQFQSLKKILFSSAFSLYLSLSLSDKNNKLKNLETKTLSSKGTLPYGVDFSKN